MSRKSRSRRNKLGPNNQGLRSNKKIEPHSGYSQKKNILVLLAVAGVIIGLIGVIYLGQTMLIGQQELQLKKTIDNYLLSKSQNVNWWFESEEEDFIPLAGKITLAERNIKKIIAQYKDDSPLVKRIADNFDIDMVSIYYHGVSKSVMIGQAGSFEPSSRSLEVCFIPRNQYLSATFPSGLYYWQDWQAIMIAGIDWSPGIFEAVFLHEMGHAIRHRVDHDPSATAAPGTDLYISEEVAMYELEQQILDVYSSGAFTAAIDQLLADGKTKDYKKFIRQLSPQDLFLLDKALGFENISRFEASYIAPEYLFAIGFRLIDQTTSDSKLAHQQKVQYYRWLTSALSAER